MLRLCPLCATILHWIWHDHNREKENSRYLGLCLSGATDTFTGSTLDVSEHTILTYFSTPLIWGKVWKEKFPHLKVTESAQAQHTRITLNWERDRVPQKGRNRHGKDGKLGLTLCSGFSSSSTNYTSYQGVSGQHILRKDVAGIHTKDIGHTWSM